MAIESTLITNRARFERMCKVLDNETVDTSARLGAMVPLIADAERYRYVAESDLRIDEIVGAALRAARVLMQHNATLVADLKSQLADFVDAQRTSDHLAQLEKLEVLDGSSSNRSQWQDVAGADAVGQLVRLAWSLVFFYYYQVKASVAGKGQSGSV